MTFCIVYILKNFVKIKNRVYIYNRGLKKADLIKEQYLCLLVPEIPDDMDSAVSLGQTIN
jgi:hypothetical protein